MIHIPQDFRPTGQYSRPWYPEGTVFGPDGTPYPPGTVLDGDNVIPPPPAAPLPPDYVAPDYVSSYEPENDGFYLLRSLNGSAGSLYADGSKVSFESVEGVVLCSVPVVLDSELSGVAVFVGFSGSRVLCLMQNLLQPSAHSLDFVAHESDFFRFDSGAFSLRSLDANFGSSFRDGEIPSDNLKIVYSFHVISQSGASAVCCYVQYKERFLFMPESLLLVN